jgi:cell wall-associated NlpC family hydrolase
VARQGRSSVTLPLRDAAAVARSGEHWTKRPGCGVPSLRSWSRCRREATRQRPRTTMTAPGQAPRLRQMTSKAWSSSRAVTHPAGCAPMGAVISSPRFLPRSERRDVAASSGGVPGGLPSMVCTVTMTPHRLGGSRKSRTLGPGHGFPCSWPDTWPEQNEKREPPFGDSRFTAACFSGNLSSCAGRI